jgi:hypothetical protein
MNRTSGSRSIASHIVGAALVTLLLTASAAEAGHRGWRGRGYHGYGYDYGPRVTFSVAIGNVAPSGWYYYDPYCGHRFRSLARYRAHRGWYDHPRVIRVVSYRGWGPAPAYRWSRGHWRDCDD